MKRVLVPKLPKADHPIEIPESEARHLTQVLRLRNGDAIEILDGKGGACRGRLQLRGKSAWAEWTGDSEATAERMDLPETLPIQLELGVLKGEAMEWAVEKAVELGIRGLTPVLTAHTVVQMDRKGPEVFQERWQKIADQALKQCGRRERMIVGLPVSLDQVLMEKLPMDCPRLWFDEAARGDAPFLSDWLSQNPKIAGLRLLIGPEGGWSEKERELLDRSVPKSSLGPLVFRAETAALFAGSLTTAHFRTMSNPEA